MQRLLPAEGNGFFCLRAKIYRMEADRMGNDKSRPTLPEIGFLRLPQIIGDAKADPPIPAIIPVSRSTWLEGVKTGRYPKSVKLSPRVTVWPVESIQELIDRCKSETE
jgi:predicted DNA-binding transcriptional regulator AlpA